LNNEPEKWYEQRWSFPDGGCVVRRGGDWFLVSSSGFQIFIPPQDGEEHAAYLVTYWEESERAFRNSLEFRREQLLWTLKKRMKFLKAERQTDTDVL
jgi:hypothetical protein